MGRLTYEGDIGLLEPLLRIGEYVHVGKNATFGLGKYRLTEGG
jgi:CRISPR/Cas system endoribonuclease Cas6 (RAMP superfamily)